MNPDLYEAIRFANLEKMRMINDGSNFDIYQVDQVGRNLIAVNCICAENDRENGGIRSTILRELADKGVDFSHTDTNGKCSIHYATGSGCPEIISELIELGSDIDAPEVGSARTPLHIAASRGWSNCVETLLSAGANPLLMDSDGLVPAETAGIRGFHQTKRIITEESDRICAYNKRLEYVRDGFVNFLISCDF